MPHLGGREANEALEKAYVLNTVAPYNVLEKDSARQVVEVLERGIGLEGQLGLKREPSLRNVRNKGGAFGGLGMGGLVGREELGKRERVDVDGCIAAGDVGGAVAREHVDVGAGDVEKLRVWS